MIYKSRLCLLRSHSSAYENTLVYFPPFVHAVVVVVGKIRLKQRRSCQHLSYAHPFYPVNLIMKIKL